MIQWVQLMRIFMLKVETLGEIQEVALLFLYFSSLLMWL